MKLLWLELNKLFWRGLRLAAVLAIGLAVLNAGVGGQVALDSQPLSTQPGAGTGTQLLHLQTFGFFHLHTASGPSPTSSSAHHHTDSDSTEAEMVASLPTRLASLVVATSESIHNFKAYTYYTKVDQNDGGFLQKLLSDYQPTVAPERFLSPPVKPHLTLPLQDRYRPAPYAAILLQPPIL